MKAKAKATDETSFDRTASTRRDFLRSTGRWGGAVGLLGLVAWLERPGRGGICLDTPLCTNCPALTNCALPDGVTERERLRHDHDQTERPAS
jgi:hypothetical protein